jgi:hypothetical protein
MRFMATPFLVVVGPFFRKVRAAQEQRCLARFAESLVDHAEATFHAGCRRFRGCAARRAGARHLFSAPL